MHFFIKMTVIIALAFGVMSLVGWLEVDDMPFREALLHTPRGWFVMGLIIVLALAYPLMSFKRVAIRGEFDRERSIMDRVIVGMGYRSVHQSADRAEYRAKSVMKRLLNQFDDRIVVSRDGNYIVVSGLKKEVVRIESLFVQYRIKVQ